MSRENQPDEVRRPSVVIHFEQCKGCGRCIVSCPNGVLAAGDRMNSLGYRATVPGNLAACTGCGICFYACPEPGAVTVYKKKRERSEPE